MKNEWSRYLALIKSGAKKTLIPAYRDMDPYDLPEEFSHLQAQDMSRLGFMQDLIRGIKKIVKTDEPKPTTVRETVVQQAAQTNTAPLLRRAFMFLEDGNFSSADEYCEKVLDLEPENAQAYLGKLMAELHVKTREALQDQPEPFDDRNNYQKAFRFGDEALKTKLSEDTAFIRERNETARLTGIYNSGTKAMNAASTESEYNSAAAIFQTIPGFKDADVLADRCLEQAESCRKDAIYRNARSAMAEDTVPAYETAIKAFCRIPGWKDADAQILACQRRIKEIKAKEEADRLEAERKAEEARIAAEKAAKERKRTIAIITPIIIACIAFVIVLTTVIIPNRKYNAAVALIEKGDVINAYESLVTLNGYKDSTQRAKAIFDQYKTAKLKITPVGDIVYFGSYEQDNDTTNGKEVIEWLVLSQDVDKILLVSKYALDCQPYNTSYEMISWKTCSLNKWLNETFLNAAFSAEEQNSIICTSFGALTYFNSDEAMKCAPTKYAIAQGARTDNSYKTDGKATCWWWLRSGNGYKIYSAEHVNIDGSIYYDGNAVSKVDIAVRPALWIDLSTVN